MAQAQEAQEAQIHDLNAHRLERYQGVGEEMRLNRLQGGLTLESVAEALRIRYANLLAIEEGRFDDLPGQAYVSGFVRAYAEYLGLDGDEILRRFRAETAGQPAEQDLHFPEPPDDGWMPRSAVVTVSIVLAVLLFGGWYLINSGDQTGRDIVAEVPETIEQAAQSAATPAGDDPDPAGAEVTGPSETTTAATETPAPIGADTDQTTIPDTAEPSAAVPSEDEPNAAEPRAPEPVATPANDGAAPSPSPIAEPPSQAPALSGPRAVRSDPQTTEAATAPTAAPSPPATVSPAATDPAPVDTVGPIAAQPAVEPEITPAEDSEGLAIGRASAAVPDEAASQPVDRVVPPPPPLSNSADGPTVFGQENTDSRVSIRAVADSWIQVQTLQNELLLTRILKAGDVYQVPNRDDVVLTTGNAGGLEILVDGVAQPPIGPTGAVRRDVSLTPDALRAETSE